MKTYKTIHPVFIRFFIVSMVLLSQILYAGNDPENDSKSSFASSPIINFLTNNFIVNGIHEFKIREKSNFNTSYLPSYYGDDNTCEPKKVLIIVYDVLGREAYTKAVIEDQCIIFLHELEGKLDSGVYMIIGSSDQKLYKQKLAVK